MATVKSQAAGPYPTPYVAPADAPMDYKMYIDGEWVESESGERFDVWSPGDGSLIGSVPKGTAADVQRAIEAAKKAQKEMAKLSIPARAKLLFKASEIAYARLEHDARVLCRECGKTIVEARDEIDHYSAPHFIEAAEGIKRLPGQGQSLHPGRHAQQAHPGHPPADGGHRHHLAVELAARHPQHRVDARAGRRQLGHPEAREHHTVQRADACRDRRGGGLPGRRRQRGHRPRRRRRRGAREQPRHQRDPLHRGDDDGRAPHADRGRQAPACSSWAATARWWSWTTRTSRRRWRRPSPAASTWPARCCTASERILVHEAVHDEFVEKLVARARAGQGRQPSRRGHRHGAAQQRGQRRQGAGALRRRAGARRELPHGREHRRDVRGRDRRRRRHVGLPHGARRDLRPRRPDHDVP